jgi:predicted site-specific integrase-resolvase
MSRQEKLTIHDIVKEMDVHEKTVRRWILSKELAAKRDISGRYIVTREALNDFIRKREERFNKSEAAE